MPFRNPANQIIFPAGATSGSIRMVIGADVPPELQAYGIQVAILAYQTNNSSGLEVGYFWIGTSNSFDGAGDNIVQAFGNVVYPTPGNPGSAVVGSVKTNFQQNMFSPYPQTVVKDQELHVWTNVIVDGPNSGPGSAKLQLNTTNGEFFRLDNDGLNSSVPGSNTTVEPWNNMTLLNSWATLAGFATPQYRRVPSPSGCVQITGLAQNGTSNSVLATLPTGYRPANAHRIPIYAFGGSMNITTETPGMTINTNGNLSILGATNATFVAFEATFPLT
jgi:hypothetical protein